MLYKWNIITETTQEVPKHQDPIYSTKIVDIKVVPDPVGETEVAWYQVVTTRLTDNVITSVHRRFREFADLNSQVKQNFKGHHLRSSIPEFPEKTPKYLTDHRDPSFMNERMNKLNNYLNITLTRIRSTVGRVEVRGGGGVSCHWTELRIPSLLLHHPSLHYSLLALQGIANTH